MKNKKMLFVSGFLTGSIFFSGISFAATQAINVNFLPIKLMVDGTLKETNESFIYKGVPYAPVTFVGQAVGKGVEWDPKTNIVTLNSITNPVADATRLSSLDYDMVYGYNYASFVDNWEEGPFTAGGVTYDHGLGYNQVDDVVNERYNYTRQAFKIQLNGKFTKLSGIFAVDDKTQNKVDQLIWRVTGDGKVLFDSTRLKAGGSQKAEINVKGVKELVLEARRVSMQQKGEANHLKAFVGNALLQ
ncbi:NPCBM/NEW2 domain-containing protein [Brevibacillus migulae]|uniref:NPCBM/NEW2 domain-containing protein n=1 Tax=Brevibacillus migulae TaxID=1644114 RepID=UPI00106EEC5D|nr:NPCBM/NEW2 domain-containing protein [Brevibacillus migulae]